jgi:SNF family Na+-dependent transporter
MDIVFEVGLVEGGWKVYICFISKKELFASVVKIKRFVFFFFFSVALFNKLFSGVVSVEYPLMKVLKKFVKPRKERTCLVDLGVLNQLTLLMVCLVGDT